MNQRACGSCAGFLMGKMKLYSFGNKRAVDYETLEMSKRRIRLNGGLKLYFMPSYVLAFASPRNEMKIKSPEKSAYPNFIEILSSKIPVLRQLKHSWFAFK